LSTRVLSKLLHSDKYILLVTFEEHFSWSRKLNVKCVIKTLHKCCCITGGEKENMNDFQCNRMLIHNLNNNIIFNLISDTAVVLTQLCVCFLFFGRGSISQPSPPPPKKKTHTQWSKNLCSTRFSLNCFFGGAGNWVVIMNAGGEKKHTHTHTHKME
jgi:hypothetical protein